MRKKLKYFTSSLAILSSFMTPKANAQLDPKMFKDLTHYFKSDMIHNSPVIGMAAFESGLIHNLRFYGSLDSRQKLDQNGQPTDERLYSADKPHVFGEQKDAVFGLLHMLFRSPAGTLEPHVAGEDLINFHSVASPEKVALLLNYVQELTQLNEPFKTDAIGQKAQNLKANHERDLPKKIAALKNKYKSFLMTPEEKKKKGLTTDIQGILNSIENAVLQELETDAEKKFLYPLHTTEQIILSYFCQKFNNQKDILDMMSHLNRNIIDDAHHQELEDRLKQNDTQDLLKSDDLEKISQKPSYNIDDIYALSHAYLFNVQVTPYNENSALINNSSCQIYDRKNDAIIASSYADCGETTARHLINLMAYDAENKKFDFTYLKEHMKGQNNPYFENFLKFYEHQTPDQANNGSINMRTLWNRVVGDLNKADDAIKVRYLKSQGDIQYELDPGIINLLHAFDKIFNLSLDSLADKAKFEEKKAWIQVSSLKLFKVFKPNQQIKFDFFYSQDDLNNHDVQGELLITVQDENQKDLFNFNFFGQAGHHGGIKKIEDLIQSIDQRNGYKNKLFEYQKKSKDKINSLEITEDIWLSSNNHDLIKKHVQNPLYKLLNHKLDDNYFKINFLVDLTMSHFKSNLELTALGKEELKQITRNILKSLSWGDPNTGTALKDHLLPFVSLIKRNQKIDEIFAYDEIQRNFEKLTFDDLKNMDDQGTLPNLRYLDIEDNTLEEYSFSESWSKKLINLVVSSTNLKNLVFTENMVDLSDLRLMYNKKIEEIEFKGNVPKLPRLQLFNLENLKKLTGLSYLTNLSHLYLKNSPNIKILEFTEDNKGLKLTLTGSGITQRSQINGIEHLDEDKIVW